MIRIADLSPIQLSASHPFNLRRSSLPKLVLCLCLTCALSSVTVAQRRNAPLRGEGVANRNVRTVTIPVTLRGVAEGAVIEPGDLIVKEDGNPQQVLSIRNTNRSPLSIAVLIQDDLVSSIGNEIEGLKKFIRSLPEGSRVLVGYIGAGSLRVRQRFTPSASRAADALRIPLGSSSASPYNPYVQIVEALRLFESQPAGRRAILVVTDGLDTSRGIDSASPSQSIDLDRAITEAQRRGVAIYGFYAPTAATRGGNSFLVNYGQGSLQKLADETGGEAYFQGTGAPVSFDPFLRRLTAALRQQYALTYLSTSDKKGFRKIEIRPEISGVEIEYPAGYTR
ncbi:MAG: hypothetical protein MSG64_13295 [Pyrinomonadaceae bacterium MAG19_C2-C3]|nr:hypothetical protein [Pyrinomonadaceae bacterium MAG19_C2-C3]